MTNDDDDLQLDVAAEIAWEAKVDSQTIAVSADDAEHEIDDRIVVEYGGRAIVAGTG